MSSSRAAVSVQALALLRTGVGLGSWLSPTLSWRAFGLGPGGADPSAGAVTRLFGMRDLAMGLALRHPDPAVRAAVLRAGVCIDGVDVVAGLVAVRSGAPRGVLVGVAAGAALFVALGALGLQDDHAPTAP